MTAAEFIAEVSQLIGLPADGAKLKIEHRKVGDMDAFLWPDADDPRRSWWGAACGDQVFAFGFVLDSRNLERDLELGCRVAAARHRARQIGALTR